MQKIRTALRRKKKDPVPFKACYLLQSKSSQLSFQKQSACGGQVAETDRHLDQIAGHVNRIPSPSVDRYARDCSIQYCRTHGSQPHKSNDCAVKEAISGFCQLIERTSDMGLRSDRRLMRDHSSPHPKYEVK
ncbi:hypothetical protein RRG08_002186 [Elysia crispata]|uniref:Uncharacterized protein n=1 Tax=Elysia crispata TaxID=231223 RepID=A0AAE0ZCK8_9GAST|nr:hypothetical protein RRG08_002186 [Elysia crispata]